MNYVVRKIKGLLIIIYALTPIILITIFGITLFNIVNDIKTLVGEPINQINTNLTQVKQNAVETGKIIDNSLKPVQEVSTEITKMLGTVNNLSIPDTLKNFSIFQSIQDILTDNFNMLNDFSKAVISLTDFNIIFNDYNQIIEEIQKLAINLQTLATELINLIFIGTMIIFMFLIQLFIIPYVRWVYHRVRKGWQLICN